MSKALLVAGGYRIGDTWHLIPILRKLAEKHDEITWMAGRYAKEVAVYIFRIPTLKIKKLIVVDEYRRPGDITDREKFCSEIFRNDGREREYEKVNPSEFDEVVTDVRCSFECSYKYNGYIGNYPELTYIDLPTRIEKRSDSYICVQPDSISKQKTFRCLENIDYPLPTFTLGKKNELKVFKSEDKRGVGYSESIKLLYQSRFNVCIHSSFACASFYLNKPTIIIHFFDGQFKFGKFHSNCLDLICPKEEEIMQAMKEFAEKYK